MTLVYCIVLLGLLELLMVSLFSSCCTYISRTHLRFLVIILVLFNICILIAYLHNYHFTYIILHFSVLRYLLNLTCCIFSVLSYFLQLNMLHFTVLCFLFSTYHFHVWGCFSLFVCIKHTSPSQLCMHTCDTQAS